MKKIFLIISVLFLSACSKVDVEPLGRKDTIVAFGDSLTFGYGAYAGFSYPEQLSKIINMKVINSGVNGNTTSDGLARLSNVLEEHKPKLVLLGLGGNDMLRKVPEQTIVSNLTSMIQKIKSKNIQVVLLATPRPSLLSSIGYLSDADFYKDVAKKESVLLIEDIYSSFLSKAEYRSDLIHLNQRGYELVAKKIADFLEDNNYID